MSELQDNGQKVLKVDVVAQDTQENRDRIKRTATGSKPLRAGWLN